MVKTRQWVLRNRATDQPILNGPDATFALITTETGVPNDGQVLIKTLCFSNDPSQRGWINAVTDNERLYVPLLPHGSPMPAYALAEIVESRTDSLDRGDLVRVWTGWSEYAVVDAQRCTKLPLLPNRLSPTHHLGALSITGLTAFFGMTDVAQATKDDVVVVSGAAGATGSMAVESLGADVCLNYKLSTFPEELAQVTPEFVNVYFDNVGGDILSLLFTCMARYGRIAACGAIVNYNHASNRSIGVKNWFEVVAMRLQIKGFVVKDYTARFEEALQVLMNALAEGKLKIDSEVEHVIEGDFENVPVVWMKLFTGANHGKLITRL
ncbi:hypothetical protein BDV24DRAFT_178476 [Aspergillus arachidicola]|uniref:Enoyl reductase (ER) domain-containing protein n=1 Tax=Aspergillus arachidicola TaxID=656916 RepID=A0A5N6XU33_9EURO|nr:hypothetical protein BDV24DRAFT_178476 [Aspergillus arachidicola]